MPNGWSSNFPEKPCLTLKPQYTFSVFNIKSFYISISLNLYEKALNFAKQITPIADSDLRIMRHSRKTLLFHGSKSFIKREVNENFDVPMGCFDGEKVCELVGTYIFSQLNIVIENANVSHYRDDGLGIFVDISGPEIEKKKKCNCACI